jgi:hypothetical protein
MLKKAIAGVLFLPALVVAQQQQGPVQMDKPVVCMETQQILPNVFKEFKEVPLWGSKLNDSKIALFVNDETKTWTLMQWNDDIACVIEAGENYFLKWPGPGA